MYDPLCKVACVHQKPVKINQSTRVNKIAVRNCTRQQVTPKAHMHQKLNKKSNANARRR